jgi:hypothetical protein
LVWNYGRLDGSPIQWDKFTTHGFCELAFWAVTLVLFFVFRRRLVDQALKITTILILAQAVNFLYVAVTFPTASFKKYHIDESTKFAFGKDRNIVLLVLDTFQSDVFQEIIDHDSRYRDVFEGFTYFPDTISTFPTTYASVTQILTGEIYDNSTPFYHFLERAFTLSPSSILLRLSEAGYRTELYPLSPKLVWLDPGSIDNLKPRNLNFLQTDLSMNFVANVGLLELAGFRISPHFLKRALFEKRGFRPPPHHGISDLNFIRASKSETRIGEDSRVFKYFHLLGAHAPFILNENLEHEPLPLSRQGYVRQAKAALEMTHQIINDIKKIGAFENALIIVTGDHGFFTQDMGIYGQAEYKSNIPQKVRASALPLLLVKRPHDQGPLTINHSPVLLSDIPATVLKNEGLPIVRGHSVFDPIPDARERTFLYFDNGIDGNYLSPFKEFLISGPSRDPRSWKETGARYARPGH